MLFSLINHAHHNLETFNLPITQFLTTLNIHINPLPDHNSINIEEISSFIDPISYELMEDAVITPYGNTFSEKSIKKWLSEQNTCPLTRKPLQISQVIPDLNLETP